MAPLADTQTAFAAAIYDAHAPIPADVFARGAPERRTRGFAAYRNNIFVALVNLMAARFPAAQRIVGEEFFRTTARAYVQERPPGETLNLSYGADFPAFLAGFPPAASLPYLPDVARLEWARHESAIAPDATRMAASSLADFDAAEVYELQFVVHPSLRVISSQYPVVSIWALNAGDGEGGKLDADAGAEDALVVRPLTETRVHRLPAGGAIFVSALARGASLGKAAEIALGNHPQLDLNAVLVTLLAAGGLSAVAGKDEA